MLLAIDIGNTNVTLGAFEGEALAATWRLATDARRTADEYGVLMRSLLSAKGVATEKVNEACLCSVVPPLTGVLEQACEAYFGVRPLVVGAGTRTGVRVLYDSPRDVGADRVVDAAATFKLYGGPAIVVDFGTATTFNAISRNGDYLGGAIAPGLGVAAESLFLNTSQLRRVELVAPKSPIGKNTVHAMQAGLVLGYVAMVEGMVQRFKAELGPETKVIATGGHSELIAQETRAFDVVNPDLTLLGLRIIFDLNRTPEGR
ncbi:MAG: type III pantothenate kinase [Chloroflexota bacterium]|nr:type III pantothenate kinase [Chloroflexota bacterium]